MSLFQRTASAQLTHPKAPGDADKPGEYEADGDDKIMDRSDSVGICMDCYTFRK
jgi:hypothetical protein